MASWQWAWLLGLSVWGLWASRRPGRRFIGQRSQWFRDWGGWILASSVGSFAPALAPDAPSWLRFGLMLAASLLLLRLAHALGSRVVGYGVVGGLGLIALFLDSLSGSVWARHGAFGHGLPTQSVGDLYGALAILWGLIVCRAWLHIEGNPLGTAYLMSLIALWLGWKGQTPALGWGAAAAALTLSLQVIRRELTERRHMRIAIQNQPVRTVRVAQGYDLAAHGGILLGVCATAIALSGAPTMQFHALSPDAGWHLATGIVCVAGIVWKRSRRPLPLAVQYAWLVGTLLTALLSIQPLGVVAMGALLYWGLLGAHLQETSRPMSNLPLRTGGNE